MVVGFKRPASRGAAQIQRPRAAVRGPPNRHVHVLAYAVKGPVGASVVGGEPTVARAPTVSVPRSAALLPTITAVPGCMTIVPHQRANVLQCKVSITPPASFKYSVPGRR